jgi:hypothetical protein
MLTLMMLPLLILSIGSAFIVTWPLELGSTLLDVFQLESLASVSSSSHNDVVYPYQLTDSIVSSQDCESPTHPPLDNADSTRKAINAKGEERLDLDVSFDFVSFRLIHDIYLSIRATPV